MRNCLNYSGSVSVLYYLFVEYSVLVYNKLMEHWWWHRISKSRRTKTKKSKWCYETKKFSPLCWCRMILVPAETSAYYYRVSITKNFFLRKLKTASLLLRGWWHIIILVHKLPWYIEDRKQDNENRYYLFISSLLEIASIKYEFVQYCGVTRE